MKTTVPPASVVNSLMAREIDRFIEAARERGEYDIDTRRRAMRRYHRSWPLLVSNLRGNNEISAALHNASVNGIGFLSAREFSVGAIVLIRLFWYEDSGLRVPAAVRHITPYRDAILTGCEFAIDDESACQAGLYANRWYD
ncbi:MAG TPA: PilZ domain-containing protein [Phycisphaerae bacterium]|nr:PilZ domain-containing protein [Phycisphaerae bacterium]